MSARVAGFLLDGGLVELLAIVVFTAFVLIAPIAISATLVLAVRQRTRRLGLLMLAFGVFGYACVVIGVALRIRVYPLFLLYDVPAGWITTSLLDGLAGFTAFIIFAVMFYFRSPIGLTKHSSEPPTGEKIST